MLSRLKNLFVRNNWMQQQSLLTKNTPDLWNISQFRQQLYFAYGNDMPGQRDFNNLHGPETYKYGPAYTAEPLTVFVNNDPENTYPVALKEEFKYTYPHAPHTSVAGELLGIRPERFVELDRYYENTIIFIRTRIWLTVPYLDQNINGYSEGTTRVAAWTYIGKSEHWKDRLDCGFKFRPGTIHDNIFMSNFYYYEGYHTE